MRVGQEVPTDPGVTQRPLIIWTLRRTGGTSLARQLFASLPFPVLEHEPFNPDRAQGGLARRWSQGDAERATVRSRLEQLLEPGPSIKHCLELFPASFNLALAELCAKRGYVHLFLSRRDALHRLLSLQSAQSSGRWGARQVAASGMGAAPTSALPVAELLRHERQCRQQLLLVHDQLRQHRAPVLDVDFADLFSSPEATVSATLRRLVEGVLGPQDEQGRASSLAALRRALASTRAMPRLETAMPEGTSALAASLHWLPPMPDAASVSRHPPPWVEASCQSAATLKREEWLLEFDPLDGEPLPQGGMAVVRGRLMALDPDQAPASRLEWRAGPLHMHAPSRRPSPMLAKRHPDRPEAGRAAFGPVEVPAWPRWPATLWASDARTRQRQLAVCSFLPLDERMSPLPGFWYGPARSGWRASGPEAEQRMARFLWQLSLSLGPQRPADGEHVGEPRTSSLVGPETGDWLQRQRTDLGGVECTLAVVLDPVEAFLQRRAEATAAMRSAWGDDLDDWLHAAEQRTLPPVLYDPTLGLADRLGDWTAYDAVLDLQAPDRLWPWMAQRIGCGVGVLARAWAAAVPVSAEGAAGLSGRQQARCAALFQNDYDALRGAREIATG